MDAALILADQILSVIRNAGVTKMEAYAALSAAESVLPTINDISFRGDLPTEQGDAPEA